MSEWRYMCELIKVVPTLRQAYAMDILEARGLRFCVDYGYVNAEEKAIAIYMAELQQQETRH